MTLTPTDPEAWRDILSGSQYEKQWDPPTDPAELHACLNKRAAAAPDAEEPVFLSRRYTGGNEAEVSQFVGGRSATINTYDPTYDPLLKRNQELTLLTAYREPGYLKPGDHRVVPINLRTNEAMPERVRFRSDQDYSEEYEAGLEAAAG